MPEKGDLDTKQFSITLPLDAIEMVENGLIPFGLYGKKLATVAANLILDALKTTAVRSQICEGREKSLGRRRPHRPELPVTLSS